MVCFIHIVEISEGIWLVYLSFWLVKKHATISVFSYFLYLTFMLYFEDTKDKCRAHGKCIVSELYICINSLFQKAKTKLPWHCKRSVEGKVDDGENLEAKSEKWPPASQEVRAKMKGFQLAISLMYLCLLLKTHYMYICREQCITI